MAHDVWLLRHGEAVPHGSTPDFQRPLTDKGERQSRAAGAALARLGVTFAACYTSPKVRAVDTARLACAQLGVEPLAADPVAGDFERDDLRDLLTAHDGGTCVLIVGHEPDMSRLVAEVTGARVEFKKGGLAAFRFEAGSGRLLALLRPAHIDALTG